jgi:DNA polymerase-3 subunit epsilon
MREIVFDTETTGLDAKDDRVIEIGCVELLNRFPTGRVFHHYVNPEGRSVHADALTVHGISDVQLAGKPTFREISADFITFIEGAKLVAHNAMFDIGFVNAELARVGHLPVETARIVDTLAIARRKHPMGPNSLDALCRRYGIDNRHRTKHGALLDAELLAEVYIELAGGKQAALGLEIVTQAAPNRIQVEGVAFVIEPRPRPLSSRLTDEEKAAHLALVATLGDKAIWSRIGA